MSRDTATRNILNLVLPALIVAFLQSFATLRFNSSAPGRKSKKEAVYANNFLTTAEIALPSARPAAFLLAMPITLPMSFMELAPV